MSALDTKFVYELTEHEMLEYVDQLRSREVLARQDRIDSAVDEIVRQWRDEQKHPTRSINLLGKTGGRWTFLLPVSRGVGTPHFQSPGTYDQAPLVLVSPAEVHVRVYPWMDEEEVRYVAREQIIEQTEWDS